jgi:hypothetical protein
MKGKLDIISQLEKCERIVNICHNVRLTHSSICTIRDSADCIKESAKSGTKVSTKRTCYTRSSAFERTEKMLCTSMEGQNHCHLPVSKRLVSAKSHSIYEDLSKGDDNIIPFNASAGCCSKFMKRCNFHNIKMMGRAALLTLAAEMFVQELQNVIEEGGYSPKQIFNISETTLFWEKMPSRTYIS